MTLRRLANSAIVWSWAQNILRLGTGLIILPLVLRELSRSELGMYWVLLSLAALAPIMDFGFAQTIGRFISYAVAGAQSLEAIGLPKETDSKEPNFKLLWQLLVTSRKLYRRLSLALLFLLGLGGTLFIEHLIQAEVALDRDFSPLVTRIAWATTLVSTLLDIYSNWWCNYLRGLNMVRTAAQVGVAAAAAKCVIAAALLIAGAGLLSLPLATLVANVIQRHFARKCCLRFLPPAPAMDDVELKASLSVLWPNSWRLGVQIMTASIVTQANMFICAKVLHLDATAGYGTAVQLMSVAMGMSYVWTLTKWPLVTQYRARADYAAIRQVLWPRIWLQMLTFVALAGAVVMVGPIALQWIGSGKELLPRHWMICLAAYTFFDLQLTTAGALITSENRLPYFWPAVATVFSSLVLSLLMVHTTTLGVGALVLAPLISGGMFNYWYWPSYAARGLNTTLFRFLFFGPSKSFVRV